MGRVRHARAARRDATLGPALLMLLLPPALLALAPVVGYPQVRAVLCPDSLPPEHVDSLAARGFHRALVHLAHARLGAQESARLRAWIRRGALAGVEVVPQWPFQSGERMAGLPGSRRYAGQAAAPDPACPCPMDLDYWRDALVARTAEAVDAEPSLRAVALDFELHGGGRARYDAPCRCAACVREYARAGGSRSSRRVADGPLARFQEKRLEQRLYVLLRGMRSRWPSLEVGVLDLDRGSFVHRALARALLRAHVGTIDYSAAADGPSGVAFERPQSHPRIAGIESATVCRAP